MSVRMTEITFEIDLESGDGNGSEVGMRLIRRGTCMSVCLFRKFGTYSSKTDISRMFRFSRHFRCFSRRFRYLERRVMHQFTIKFWS